MDCEGQTLNWKTGQEGLPLSLHTILLSLSFLLMEVVVWRCVKSLSKFPFITSNHQGGWRSFLINKCERKRGKFIWSCSAFTHHWILNAASKLHVLTSWQLAQEQGYLLWKRCSAKILLQNFSCFSWAIQTIYISVTSGICVCCSALVCKYVCS